MSGKESGSAALVASLMRKGRGFDAIELQGIADMAAKHGGALVAVGDVDDDWCGTGRIHVPHRGVGPLVEDLVAKGIGVIINGIPAPHDVVIQISQLNAR